MTGASQDFYLLEASPGARKAVGPRLLRPAQPPGELNFLPVPPGVPWVVVIIVTGPTVPPTRIIIPTPAVVVVMVTISVPVPMVIRSSITLPALRRPVTAMVSLIAAPGEISPYFLNGSSFGGMAKSFARLCLGKSLGAGGPTNCQDRSSQEKSFEALS